jgi:5-hydroxyisourate hydrolase
MSPITTHVLDTTLGRPAADVPVTLDVQRDGAWQQAGHGVTDADGRLRTLLDADGPLSGGVYRLTFDTAAYFARVGIQPFYPRVLVEFTVADGASHYHVPLLLSPFGYTTYRGT